MQLPQHVEPTIGGHYRVIRPAESFEDIDGSLVHLERVDFVAEILGGRDTGKTGEGDSL